MDDQEFTGQLYRIVHPRSYGGALSDSDGELEEEKEEPQHEITNKKAFLGEEAQGLSEHAMVAMS